MNSKHLDQLEEIASNYHLKEDVPDKFIEDICQDYCCDWLEAIIDPDDRIIELGYGEGITVDRLAHSSRHYTVVEGSTSLVDKCRRKHPDIEVIHSFFETYTPDQRYDKILALHVFEHVDDPVQLACHLRGWLKPEGEIIVIVPNRESLHRRLALLMGLTQSLDELSPRDHLVGHQRVYDLAGLEADLREAGYEPLTRDGFFLKVLPNGMMLDHSHQLISALNTLGRALPVEMTANLAVRARPV